MPRTVVVTGAFGYSGKYIAQRLLAAGDTVRTLTNSPDRANPFDGAVEVHGYHFDDPAALEQALAGADALINTYWVRFNHRDFNHSEAVTNTQKLFTAAQRAGVRRVVHVSITNPSLSSPLPYFEGKARLEAALMETGLSFAILRPTVLFGTEDILINNIAWMLRRFPVFGLFGDGRYRLQPIYVDDLAELAVTCSAGSDNQTIDAIGPETFSYRELVTMVGDAVGRRRPMVSLPPWLGYRLSVVMGWLLGDVVVTREEIQGLMADLLVTDSPPAGHTALSDWCREHADTLGRRYSSELARRRDRRTSYEALR